MHHDPNPLLDEVPITHLRPTQLNVGLREVARKRASWVAMTSTEERHFLGRHLIPVVIGPKKRRYILDNHHLARALHEQGIAHVLTHTIADVHHLGRDAFWRYMDNRNWLRLYDAQGRLHPFSALPKTVAELKDDPYRSLAGDLRRAGGLAKEPAPYAEFLWADHLRACIRPALIDADYDKALSRALGLAKRSDAAYLPGWCGVES
jgi:hypothetical protein